MERKGKKNTMKIQLDVSYDHKWPPRINSFPELSWKFHACTIHNLSWAKFDFEYRGDLPIFTTISISLLVKTRNDIS